MWMKAGNRIITVKENAVICKDGSSIRLSFDRPGQVTATRGSRLAEYIDPKRAQEVIEELWTSIKLGRDWYEFPDL